MFRTAAIALALLAAPPALACKMADAQAYAAAAETVKQAEGAKATFSVDGMHCGDCSNKITTALTAVDGVLAAAVDYQSGETVVAFDTSKTNADALLSAIKGSGFKATKVENKT